MDKFWKWIIKKGYGSINGYTKKHLLHSGQAVEPTKHMLIGYMIEYLSEVMTSGEAMLIGRNKWEIDKAYRDLEEKIEEVAK